MATPAVSGLVAWLLVGVVVLGCAPAARGDALLGSTLPFWLVGAPIVNLAWVAGRRWLRTHDLREAMGSLAKRRAAARMHVAAVRAPVRARARRAR